MKNVKKSANTHPLTTATWQATGFLKRGSTVVRPFCPSTKGTRFIPIFGAEATRVTKAALSSIEQTNFVQKIHFPNLEGWFLWDSRMLMARKTGLLCSKNSKNKLHVRTAVWYVPFFPLE